MYPSTKPLNFSTQSYRTSAPSPVTPTNTSSFPELSIPSTTTTPSNLGIFTNLQNKVIKNRNGNVKMNRMGNNGSVNRNGNVKMNQTIEKPIEAVESSGNETISAAAETIESTDAGSETSGNGTIIPTEPTGRKNNENALNVNGNKKNGNKKNGNSANATGNAANATGNTANATGNTANATGNTANATGNSANTTGKRRNGN
jgi:hypothetical protein